MLPVLVLHLAKVSVVIQLLYILLQFGSLSANVPDSTVQNYNLQDNTCNNKISNITSGSAYLAFLGSRGNLPHNVTCIWNFDFPKENEEIIFNVESFFLFKNDSFVIHDMKGQIMFGPYTGYQGNFVIATGNNQLVVTLKTSPEKYISERSFLVKFSYKDCRMVLSNLVSGTLSSPVYSEKREKPLYCKYEINGSGTTKLLQSLALTLTNFTFGGDSFLELTNGKIKIASNDTNFPKKIFGKGKIEFEMVIKPQKNYQRFKIIYDLVPDACSGNVHLNEFQPNQKIAFATRDNPVNSALTRDLVTCSWRIISPPGTKIQSIFAKLQLNSIEEQLVVSSPGNTNFHPILLSSSNSHMFRDKPIVSPANEFWVKFSSFQAVSGSEFIAVFALFKENVLNENSGEITIKQTGTHQFKVQENKFVAIIFDRKVTNGIVMDLYPDLSNAKSHFITIDNEYPLNWIVSPTNQLKIVVQQFFKQTPLKLKFEAINKGCNSTLVDKKGSFILNQTCKESRTCFLVLPHGVYFPQDVNQYRIEIETMGSHITVSPLVGNKQAILEMDNLHYAINERVNAPIESGALIAIRANCQPSEKPLLVKISYKTEKDCENVFKLSPGESITISSPDYPNGYPCNSKCHWNIEPSSVRDNVLYFVTFNQFQIKSNDFMRLKSNGNEISLRKQNIDSSIALPEDFIFKSSLEIFFESRKAKSSLTYPKFLLRLTAIECGGIETTSTGTISVTSQNESSQLCIWSISVPLLERFTFTNIEIHIAGGHNSGVTVYDGESTRTPLLSLSIDGTAKSTSNRIIIVYDKSKSWNQTPVQVEYKSLGCSKENVCNSGSCMKPGWKCNGINDCGDYSDEVGCVIPTPTSTTLKTSTKTSVMDKATTETVSQSKHTTSVPFTITNTVTKEKGTFTPEIVYTVKPPQKQSVKEDSNQVSITTMVTAIAGVVLVCCATIFLVGFVINRRAQKKMGFNRNHHFQSLSSTNASYQSDKAIVSI